MSGDRSQVSWVGGRKLAIAHPGVLGQSSAIAKYLQYPNSTYDEDQCGASSWKAMVHRFEGVALDFGGLALVWEPLASALGGRP